MIQGLRKLTRKCMCVWARVRFYVLVYNYIIKLRFLTFLILRRVSTVIYVPRSVWYYSHVRSDNQRHYARTVTDLMYLYQVFKYIYYTLRCFFSANCPRPVTLFSHVLSFQLSLLGDTVHFLYCRHLALRSCFVSVTWNHRFGQFPYSFDAT